MTTETVFVTFKEPRNRFQGIDNRFQGIDSKESIIDSKESIPPAWRAGINRSIMMKCLAGISPFSSPNVHHVTREEHQRLQRHKHNLTQA
jgi:hypothetical protein